ncbi:MAG: hypothetical protein GQ581_05480 [Methyloprofundus sp.]|nr:hypothetical protein [Methyloprofundus sp.]
MRQLTLKSSIVVLASVFLLSACEKMKQERPKKNQAGVSKSLDLSLDLGVNDGNASGYAANGSKNEQLQGLFKPKKEASNLEWEAHFETSHQESEEKEPLYDGLGVGVKVGI